MINSWALLRPLQKTPNPKAPSSFPCPPASSQLPKHDGFPWSLCSWPAPTSPAGTGGKISAPEQWKSRGKGWEKLKTQRGRSSVWRLNGEEAEFEVSVAGFGVETCTSHLIPPDLVFSKGDKPSSTGMGYTWTPSSSFWEHEEDFGSFPVVWTTFPCDFNCWVSPEVVTQDKGVLSHLEQPMGMGMRQLPAEPMQGCTGKGTRFELAWISPIPSPSLLSQQGQWGAAALPTFGGVLGDEGANLQGGRAGSCQVLCGCFQPLLFPPSAFVSGNPGTTQKGKCTWICRVLKKQQMIQGVEI